MSEQIKFQIPTEIVELPSKGLVYPKDNPLSSGKVELKYMTAKEEDILTNINNLKNGTAIEKMLKSLIVSDVNYDDLILGDRNGLLIAARILAYGGEYSFTYSADGVEEQEVKANLQDMDYKEFDESAYLNGNNFDFELPFSKTKITFKLLTVADDKKIDSEISSIKKNLGIDAGAVSTRLKYQITSVNGSSDNKTIREFVDKALLSRDSVALRQYISKITPDIEMKAKVTLNNGEEVVVDVPMNSSFFFPGAGI